MLKGRLPSDKDLKREISQAFGYCCSFIFVLLYFDGCLTKICFLHNFLIFSSVKREYDDLSSKSLEAEKEVKLVQMKIQDATNHTSKLQKDLDGSLFLFYLSPCQV